MDIKVSSSSVEVCHLTHQDIQIALERYCQLAGAVTAPSSLDSKTTVDVHISKDSTWEAEGKNEFKATVTFTVESKG